MVLGKEDKSLKKKKVELVVEKTIKYVPKEEQTIKYVPKEEKTTKYKVEEKPTVKYVPSEERTIKYNVTEVPCEKPVVQPKRYDVPDRTSLQAIREAVKGIADSLKLLPDFIRNVKGIIEAAKAIPEVLAKFNDMKKMIESHKEPKFREIIVERPVIVDKTVYNAVIKDVEVNNAVIRDKVYTIDEYKKEQEKRGKGK